MGERMMKLKPFRRTGWRGRINYECARCAYATLDALRMAEHLRVVHGAEMKEVETAAAQKGREPIVLVENGEFREVRND